MVQIPAGTAPNAIIQVRAPDGRTLNVRVPPNVRPGQQMRISVPAAAPKATKPASEAQERDARRQRREEAARDRAVKAAKEPANPSRGRLPVAGLVGRSFGLYQKDQKAWLALDETKRLVKINVGNSFSRESAKKLCEQRGGRLAYRREIVDEKTLGATPKLLVNGGRAFGGDKRAPVSLMIVASGSTPSTRRCVRLNAIDATVRSPIYVHTGGPPCLTATRTGTIKALVGCRSATRSGWGRITRRHTIATAAGVP